MPIRPTYRAAFAKRLQRAHTLKQFRVGGRISQLDIAIYVSKKLRLSKSLTSAAVSAWMRGESLPDQETQIVLAIFLDCDAGWLMAGDFTTASAPEGSGKAKSMSLNITPLGRKRGRTRREDRDGALPLRRTASR